MSTDITPEILTSALKTKVGAVHVELTDTSGGCGQMYEAVIVSPLFEGKGTLARHRMVNAALKEEIAGVHAWTQKCMSMGEWEKKKEEEK